MYASDGLLTRRDGGRSATANQLRYIWRRSLFWASVSAVVAQAISVARKKPPALSAPAIMVMERTPPESSMRLLAQIGIWSRPIGQLGGFAVYLMLGGTVGLLARASWWGRALSGAISLLAYRWFAGRTDAGAALVLALGPLAAQMPSSGGGQLPARNRRDGLTSRLEGWAPVLGALGLTALWLFDHVRRNRTPEPYGQPLFEPDPVRPRVSSFPVEGQPAEVTPVTSHYLFSINLEDPVPSLDEWRLQITGEVARPTVVDFATLTAFPRVDQFVTLQCVGNPLDGPFIGNGLWSGTPLASILTAAGPLPKTQRVICRGYDGLYEDIPLDVAMAKETIVAYALDGKMLDRHHGYPARLLIPGRYGFKNVKWLQSIEVVTECPDGYWAERGWDGEGTMRTLARVQVARRVGDVVQAAGVAVAGNRGVLQVEARVITGEAASEWVKADLHLPALGPASWVQWRAQLPVVPGEEARVEARAVDGHGQMQSVAPTGPFPAGATGLHSLAVATP